jgi:hypothetical protein
MCYALTPLAVGLVLPPDSIHRSLSSVASYRHRMLTEERRLATLAGAFSFVATSPG